LGRPCAPSFLFSAICDWRQLNSFRDIENEILKLQASISKNPLDTGQPPLDRWFQFLLRYLDLHRYLLRFEARAFLLLLPTFIILFNSRLLPPQSFNILVLDWVRQRYCQLALLLVQPQARCLSLDRNMLVSDLLSVYLHSTEYLFLQKAFLQILHFLQFAPVDLARVRSPRCPAIRPIHYCSSSRKGRLVCPGPQSVHSCPLRRRPQRNLRFQELAEFGADPRSIRPLQADLRISVSRAARC